MAEYRKDPKGRVLRKGENYRTKDHRYEYKYTDPLGKRKSIYANDLAELRKKEDDLKRDQLDGLKTYAEGNSTINQAYDRYIKLKKNIRSTTRANYDYLFDKYVRETFGKKKLSSIVTSDIKMFYNHLMEEVGLQVATIDSIHGILHPLFDMAVQDDVIRRNPTDGVMKEYKKANKPKKRLALTRPQQKAFLEYVKDHKVYRKWHAVFVFMLGTGVRAGELSAITWDDCDFEARVIHIRHNLVYDSLRKEQGKEGNYSVNNPKTSAGIRSIPMLDAVYDALMEIREDQKANGFNKTIIDGYSGFVFKNKDGNCLIDQNINKVIARIVDDYNNMEEIESAKQKREPVLLPAFSCHILRHTFCCRLCEVEKNLKIIQSVMGHENIETSLNIYAEATDDMKKESFDELSNKFYLF